MQFVVERNWIEAIGPIWWPAGQICAMRYDLSAHDVDNIGEVTRENVEQWLATHSGDFQHVKDFYAAVGETEISWQDEENEFTYTDCMYGNED